MGIGLFLYKDLTNSTVAVTDNVHALLRSRQALTADGVDSLGLTLCLKDRSVDAAAGDIVGELANASVVNNTMRRIEYRMSITLNTFDVDSLIPNDILLLASVQQVAELTTGDSSIGDVLNVIRIIGIVAVRELSRAEASEILARVSAGNRTAVP